MKYGYRVRKVLKGLMIPLIWITVLLIVGTVYADDGVSPPETVDTSLEGSLDPSGEETAQVSNAPPEDPDEGVEEVLIEEPEDADEGRVDLSADGIEEPLPEDEIAEEELSNDEEAAPLPELQDESEVSEENEEDLSGTTTELAQNEIRLVDANGDALDLASSTSLEIVSSADPWWMVGTVKYAYIMTGGTCPGDTTVGVTCFESGTPISAALAYMDANNLVPSDGILHVEPDDYTGSVVINGLAGNGYLANLKGLISEGSSSDTSITGSIQITNTLLGFTLSGFTIIGDIYLNNNIGTLNLVDLDVSSTSSSGIFIVNQNGAVNVDRVKSSNNNNYGMYVDNTAGIYPITITNSEFNHNDDGISSTYFGGLQALSNSTITLNGVSASDNDGNGASLNAVKGTTVKNSVFNNNFADPISMYVGIGLYVNNAYTTNNILLENVQADGNDNRGIMLTCSGKVTLTNVNANANSVIAGYDGIVIDNTNGIGTVAITNSSSTNSGGKGFYIRSHNKVTINGITATGNDEDGVNIDNCDFDWGNNVCLGSGPVTISGKLPNLFNDNNDNGLHILSGGSVTLSYFQANDNEENGVYIDADHNGASGNVTLNLSYKPPLGDWINTASGNNYYGLNINARGNILVDKVLVEQNVLYGGAYLYNPGALSAKTVTVNNSSFSQNISGIGLEIISLGNVSLMNVNASQNPSYGVKINNGTGTGNVSISGSKTFICNFIGNGSNSIHILSAGTVTLKNILAAGNGFGLYIVNTAGEGKAVNITNGDFSDSINGPGIQITSNGAIYLKDVSSNNNGSGGGALIRNDTAAKAQIVKLTNCQFNGNIGANGLDIDSLATITLSSVQANNNGSIGADIDACQYNGGILGCEGIGSVVLTGSDNQFNGNASNGLTILARNSITMKNITADGNGNNGIYIYHTYGNCGGNISLGASSKFINSTSGNGSYGLFIESRGNITLQYINSSNNDSYGIYASNQFAVVGKKVTISYATVNDNQHHGLAIYSTGAVTLTGVQVLRSSKYFWEIQDDNGAIVYDRLPFDQVNDEIWWFEGSLNQDLTVNLNSTTFDAYLELYDEDWHLLSADDNNGGGENAQIDYLLGAAGTYYLRVSSAVAGQYGPYDLSIDGPSPVTAYNQFSGVFIDNRYNGSTGNVTIIAPKGSYGLEIRDSNLTGIYVFSNGSITISGACVDYNGGYWGANITNDGVEGKPISMKNSTFDNNDGLGVEIYSKGNITWSGGSASSNQDYHGAYITNENSGASRPISLANLTFDSNDDFGLTVNSIGAITLKNVRANDNLSGQGAVLDNCQYTSGACTGSGNVTISGTYGLSNFNNNATYGLAVNSFGTITLINVNASGNGTSNGVSLNNNHDDSVGSIIIKNGSKNSYSEFSSNGGHGLYVESRGTMTLSNIIAQENVGNGIEATNAASLTPKKATLTKIKTGGNTNYGMWVGSSGMINLSYAEDYGNGSVGISLTNQNSMDPQGVMVTRTKIEGNTTGTGLMINSKGDLTLNNVSSINNNYGAWLSNDWGTGAKVTILGSMGDNVFSANNQHGLYIRSTGDVLLSNIVAESNGADGVNVSTDSALTITNSRVARNTQNGVYAIALKGATITSLQSINNGTAANDGDGLYLSMSLGSLAKITKSAFLGNAGNGIDLWGDSNPVLTGTFYFGNDSDNDGDLNLYIR